MQLDGEAKTVDSSDTTETKDSKYQHGKEKPLKDCTKMKIKLVKQPESIDFVHWNDDEWLEFHFQLYDDSKSEENEQYIFSQQIPFQVQLVYKDRKPAKKIRNLDSLKILSPKPYKDEMKNMLVLMKEENVN